jgi:uncharacterized protein (UPF0210 family)
MKIRSITCFYDPTVKGSSKILKKLQTLIVSAIELFKSKGIEVQTSRLATIPFPKYGVKSNQLLERIKSLEEETLLSGFSYLSIGHASPKFPESYELIVPVLRATESTFCSGKLLRSKNEISTFAIKACAKVIQEASTISPDGFTNCRFAATANVNPFCPFFPSAYSKGSEPGFALALESADLAVSAFEKVESLDQARDTYTTALEENAHRLEKIARKLESLHGVRFLGLDFSTAPFPADHCSAGLAMERIAGAKLAGSGTLAAAAFIASALSSGNWKKVGFNGLMLPVLEDSILAKRASEGTLTVNDLLMVSAVCGTGLDTVPLAGDIPADYLETLLMDIAALSARLMKPLTARLLPIPGKKAGDATKFSFEYFINTKVMKLQRSTVDGLLRTSDSVPMTPR